MKSYIIHLLRNAPSEGNIEGRYIGRTQSPLANEGIELLLDLKRNYEYPHAESFYAGPSISCVDTLKILYPEAEPEVILELAECDFGDFENKTPEELQSSTDYLDWIQNGGKDAPPDGESGAVFSQRVLRGFGMLVDNLMHDGKTESILVAHGGIIMTILAAHGLPQAEFYDWMCEPGAGYSIRITPGIWRSKLFEVYGLVPSVEESGD